MDIEALCLELKRERRAHRAKYKRHKEDAPVVADAAYTQKVRGALECVWQDTRKALLRQIQWFPGPLIGMCPGGDDDRGLPCVLTNDREHGSSVGNRMAMVYIRDKAMADSELTAAGLRAVHMDWHEDMYGYVWFEFPGLPARASPEAIRGVVTDVMEARAIHQTVQKVPVELLAYLPQIQETLLRDGGLKTRVYHNMLVWDAVVPLPPVSEWSE